MSRQILLRYFDELARSNGLKENKYGEKKEIKLFVKFQNFSFFILANAFFEFPFDWTHSKYLITLRHSNA